jgi:S-adenosylmethionine:tRNA ribosyltransferase-isomerase
VKTSDFDYELPPECIAQAPVEPRDAARLLVLNRKTGERTHTRFDQVANFLHRGDLLVVNRSRVIPARLFARKLPGGGKLELLLLEKVAPATWKAIVGGKGMQRGKRLMLENGLVGEIFEMLQGAQRLIHFEEELEGSMEEIGQVPLPPYIHRRLEDPERYQTIYAREAGSAAAPTAGLHFTAPLLGSLRERGVAVVELLLHVGLDTFVPVSEARPEEHLIHSEWCRLDEAVAAAVNACKRAGGKVVAVGTTSVRVLETGALSAGSGEVVGPFEGRTDLFILPGHQFKVVDAMITNFHLPRSTLLMLVSAFAGRQQVLACYHEAVNLGYRFFSFGDAMLIV